METIIIKTLVPRTGPEMDAVQDRLNMFKTKGRLVTVIQVGQELLHYYERTKQ